MYSTPFKRPRLDLTFDKQTFSSNRNSITLSSYNNSVSFLSSPPIAWNLSIQNVSIASLMGHCQAHNQTFRSNPPIDPPDLLSAQQFAVCQRLEEEKDEGPGTDVIKGSN